MCALNFIISLLGNVKVLIKKVNDEKKLLVINFLLNLQMVVNFRFISRWLHHLGCDWTQVSHVGEGTHLCLKLTGHRWVTEPAVGKNLNLPKLSLLEELACQSVYCGFSFLVCFWERGRGGWVRMRGEGGFGWVGIYSVE